MLVAGGGQRADRHAVKAVGEADDVRAAGDLPRDFHRGFDGVGSRRAGELDHIVEPARLEDVLLHRLEERFLGGGEEVEAVRDPVALDVARAARPSGSGCCGHSSAIPRRRESPDSGGRSHPTARCRARASRRSGTSAHRTARPDSRREKISVWTLRPRLLLANDITLSSPELSFTYRGSVTSQRFVCDRFRLLEVAEPRLRRRTAVE